MTSRWVLEKVTTCVILSDSEESASVASLTRDGLRPQILHCCGLMKFLLPFTADDAAEQKAYH